MFTPFLLMAATGEEGESPFSPANLVIMVTPFIVLGATALFKWATNLKGNATLYVAFIVSALLPIATNYFDGADGESWIAKLGIGLAATFFHQLAIKFEK